MKYEAPPPPSRIEDVIEWLAREHRRLASHTHEELYWDDLRAPATAIQGPGVRDPDWDTSAVGWLFDSTLEEELHLIFQLPHDWAQTDLQPHVHWEKTTSATGNVNWKMAYRWSPLHGTRTAEVTAEADTPVVYTAGADWQMLTSFGTITASAATGISDTLIIRLSRDASATADTYAADARMLEFDIHYQRNRGSVYLYEKG